MLLAIYLLTSKWHDIDDMLIAMLATFDVFLAIIIMVGILSLADKIN